MPRPHHRQRCPVSRGVPSGLWLLVVSVIDRGPRALPWAEVGRAVGTWNPCGTILTPEYYRIVTVHQSHTYRSSHGIS